MAPETRKEPMPPSLAPELDYVADLARAWASGVAGTVPPPAGLDPAALGRLLNAQPAMQTLAASVAPEALGPGGARELALAAEVARRRTGLMLLELERILPALADAGCRPVVLKGAALALTVYPRPEERWFVDLDLWVPREQVAAARGALEGRGYRLSQPDLARRYYRRHHFHEIMISDQGACVEIHWALTLPDSVYRHDLDRLDAGATPRALGQARLRVPSAVDQVLHGVLQSVAGGFGDLRRILDLHRLEATLEDRDREVLVERALAANLGTALWLHHRLRADLLGAAMPAVVDRGCRPPASLIRTLEDLRVGEVCLGWRPPYFEGYTRLLHWLCTPRALRPREVGRYLWPGEADLLVAGLDPGRRLAPGLWSRLWVERVMTALRLAGRLTRTPV